MREIRDLEDQVSDGEMKKGMGGDMGMLMNCFGVSWKCRTVEKLFRG